MSPGVVVGVGRSRLQGVLSGVGEDPIAAELDVAEVGDALQLLLRRILESGGVDDRRLRTELADHLAAFDLRIGVGRAVGSFRADVDLDALVLRAFG